jgi:hypothetical protein
MRFAVAHNKPFASARHGGVGSERVNFEFEPRLAKFHIWIQNLLSGYQDSYQSDVSGMAFGCNN